MLISLEEALEKMKKAAHKLAVEGNVDHYFNGDNCQDCGQAESSLDEGPCVPALENLLLEMANKALEIFRETGPYDLSVR